jgi:glycerophosphoryl diester phosphodiesterase
MAFSWLHLSRTPLIIAHRGSSLVAPENTLAAFRRAIGDGADAIELDVQLTLDGELVVIHDVRLERTTNGRGFVREHTLPELHRLSAGNWFHERFADERVPTLEEVMQLAAPANVGLNIELKFGGRPSHHDVKEVVYRCAAAIVRRGAQQSILVSSFHYPAVRLMKHRHPHLLAGLLVHPIRHAVRAPVRLAREIGAEFIIFSGTSIRKRVVRRVHEEGMRVIEYTINRKQRLDRALRYQLDAIITDDPARIRAILSK